MSATPEQYREVFRSPTGQDVLNDLIAWVERRAESERVGGYAVVARITKMTNLTHQPPRPRVLRAGGGRIAHSG